MRVYGLTGGIASGKSTVARMLIDLGASIVDADVLSREVVEPGQAALADIADTFGSRYLTKNGELDRAKLGSLIFSDEKARKILNTIMHPHIARAGQLALKTLEERGNSIALYEAPLLVENNLHLAMTGLIVVSIPVKQQLKRLVARDGLSTADARARLDAQLPLSQKLAVADYIIDNSGDEESTRIQVEKLWKTLNAVQPLETHVNTVE